MEKLFIKEGQFAEIIFGAKVGRIVKFLTIFITIPHLLLLYRLYSAIFTNFPKGSLPRTRDSPLEILEVPEIESSELGNKSFRYPSLHMLLQFTFARRLDFKMLISNSAIKRAGDQEKRNEKKNIRIYVYRAACHEEHLLLPIEKELE